MENKTLIITASLIIAFGLTFSLVFFINAGVLSTTEIAIPSIIVNNKKAVDKETIAKLSLVASSQNIKVGDILAVDVMVDSQEALIDGVDVVLQYNGMKIRPVADSLLNKDQSIFTEVLGLMIDDAKNIIEFSGIVNPGSSFRGKGKVATLYLEAINTGNAEISFISNKGVTKNDSNVSSYDLGGDILAEVDGLSLVIQ